MELKEINSLVELFFKKFKDVNSNNVEKEKSIFLVSLKEKNKGNKAFSYSWGITNKKLEFYQII